MRRTFFLIALILSGFGATLLAQGDYDTYFTEKSLRIDFTLTGDAESQTAGIRLLREEPVWSGPRANRVDPFDYGGYRVKVYDQASGQLIYSRGFNTLFEEWRTTAQARAERQAWDNSVVIPSPKVPVRVELEARERSDMKFHKLLAQTIDPSSLFIDRSPLRSNPVTVIQREGEPAEKVDLVFVAEGYTAKERKKFEADARRFTEALFQTPPFDRYRSAFNVYAVAVPSEESGTDMAGEDIFRNTALNSGFYTFGIDRYLTTPDMRAIRDAVWETPCDALFVLVNSERYGGGGMYNFYAIGTADNQHTLSVFTHELGHSFAGLADEYFTSEVAYESFYNLKYEPWEPNITTLVNFEAKWKDLLPADTPIPTPLEEPYKDKAGVFEGGGYVAKGIYRPMDHCMMRDYAPFCPVCQEAIIRMIHYYEDRPIRPAE